MKISRGSGPSSAVILLSFAKADAFGLFFLRGASQEIPFKLDVYTAQFYFVQDSVVPGEVLWILLL